jgi:hypothetical protein
MFFRSRARFAWVGRALAIAALGIVALASFEVDRAAPASASSPLIEITSPANGATVVPQPVKDGGVTYQVIYFYGRFTQVGILRRDVFRPVVDGIPLKGFIQADSVADVGASATASTFRFPFAAEDMTPSGLTFLGTHTIAFQYGVVPSMTPIATSAPVTVTFALTLPTATPTPTPTSTAVAPPPVVAGSEPPQTSRLRSGRADAPSFLRAIPTAQDLKLTPTRALITAALTVILMLLVGFPGQLIGSTLSDNYDRAFGWTEPITSRLKRATAAVEKLPRWAVIAIGVTLASIISSFVDPQFGFNLGSLRVLLEVAVAFLVQSLLGWFVVGKLVRRSNPELRPVVEFKALSLLIVIVAVVISRLTGFEPGIVFGLIVGLNFGAALTATHKARIALTGSAYAFVVAILGWIGYSIAVAAFGAHPGLAGAFVIETLSGFAVAGIATLPISLLPIRSLAGGEVFEWKRWVWAVSYGIGLFAFLVILLPLPFSWGTVHLPLIIWVALYAAYALAAVGFWAFFRFVDPDKDKHPGAKDEVAAEPEVTPAK